MKGVTTAPNSARARFSAETNPRPRWLGASVLGFGLASFLSDAGHEAATSALPALLLSLGAAPAALGIIEGVSDGLSSLAKLAGGWWADRRHLRKPIVVAGYLVTGLSTGIFGFASSWMHVLGARALGWFARGVRGPARDAMLAEAAPPEALGRAFGFHRMMDTAGAIAGPATAVVLIGRVPLRSVFLLSLVPGVLAALAVALLVRPAGEGTARGVSPFWRSLRELPRSYRRFLLGVFVFGAGDFARTLLILRAIELLAPRIGGARATAVALSLYAFHNVLYSLASYPVGRLADHLGARRLLVTGYVLGAGAAGLAAAAVPSLPMLAALFAVAGLTLAFEDTLEGAIVAREVPRPLWGTGYGALAATNGVGDLISSALTGVLWSALGPRPAFAVAACLCTGGALLLALTRPRDGAGQ